MRQVQLTADIAAGGTVVATLMGWLPPLAAGAALIWTALQIYWAIRDRYFNKDKK
jgi:hypothetical protein